MSDPIPEKLGKYEVNRELSRGSMGIVYQGYDPFVDRDVALKVALADSLNDEESGERYRKMFFNEAHTAGSLTHPNIIHILDAGVDQEVCYIVMEYIEGGETIKPLCRTDNLQPVEKVVEIIFKCAKALDYAHRQGVIHRDIKPTNILFTPDGDIKIGDFSIAHITNLDATETMPMGMVGSPRYMSPEQINEDYVTTQTDLFSLGIIMYEMLTGRHPFDADNFSRLIFKILNDEPPSILDLRPELPESLYKIVCKALAKNKDDRYQMGLEMASDLSKAFSNLERPEEDIDEHENFNDVQSLDFFQGFADTELWEIVRASSWQEYNDGEEIITEGDLDDSFYIIVSGSVRVRKSDKDLRSLEKGDCFGEMGYLAKTKRTATIIAIGQSKLLKINSTVISQVTLNCQVRFLKVFLRTLIHRLSITTEKISQEM